MHDIDSLFRLLLSQGRVLHTSEYKHTRGFEDKRILVVGSGTSAGEAAVELSKVTKQVRVLLGVGLGRQCEKWKGPTHFDCHWP